MVKYTPNDNIYVLLCPFQNSTGWPISFCPSEINDCVKWDHYLGVTVNRPEEEKTNSSLSLEEKQERKCIPILGR